MNKDYTQQLILKICSQPRSLDFITQHLHGVDPITTFEFLKELEKQNLVRCNDQLWLIEENARKGIGDLLSPNSQVYLKKFMGDFDFFKKPHPLDFEWRNTKRSIKYLSDLVLQTSTTDEEILILGMPTLFANLCRMDLSQKITIVERNTGVIEALKELSNPSCKVIESDIFQVDPDKIGRYATVVMDPPWYEPHFKQFIWLANRCLELGGRLIISIPPINTRPGIDEERIKWFSFCQKQGLCLQNLYAGKLEYTMPFFEWNAMRIAGAISSPTWRKGDLAIFQKLNMYFMDRPKHSGNSEVWKEVEINSCRIRINVGNNSGSEELGEFSAAQPAGNPILPTVSSRDVRRDKANVWTSGNRIYITNSPVKLLTHLQWYKEGIKKNSIENQKIFEFIKFVTTAENDEHNNYLEWIYNEMERDNLPVL